MTDYGVIDNRRYDIRNSESCGYVPIIPENLGGDIRISGSGDFLGHGVRVNR